MVLQGLGVEGKGPVGEPKNTITVYVHVTDMDSSPENHKGLV